MFTSRYKQYLTSKEWARKRQQVFAYYGKKCYACKRARKVLHVHHVSYDHFGNEPMSDLMPLCPECHRFVTKLHRRHRRRGLRTNTEIAINLIRKSK